LLTQIDVRSETSNHHFLKSVKINSHVTFLSETNVPVHFRAWQRAKYNSLQLTLVRVHFSVKSMRPGFLQWQRHKFAKIEKKTALETLPFCVENVIHILLDAMYCGNFGRFYGRKFKKITNKAIKAERYHFYFLNYKILSHNRT